MPDDLPDLEWTCPDVEDLVATPDELDTFVGHLKGARVTRFPQYGGRTVWALTVGEPSPDKQRLFVSRPHAHEPAGTAACVEILRVLCGKHSHPVKWRDAVLDQFVVTFIPDANPSGTKSAPVRFWDGTRFPNSEFFFWMFGESGEIRGERFPRMDAWDIRNVVTPARIGIAYEQIDEHTYVEPNRDLRSTFFRSFHALDETYAYDVWLDLHQTEFQKSDRNCSIHLPTGINALPSQMQHLHRSLGERIITRWVGVGARPRPEPQEPYRNNPTQHAFLSKVWLPVARRMVHIVTEVQNNSTATGVAGQVGLQIGAVDQTLRWMLAEAEALRGVRAGRSR